MTNGIPLIGTAAQFGTFGKQEDLLPKQNINALTPDRFVASYQFERLKQDAKSWRDGVIEAENAWVPHRVKQQRIYNDTRLNGHVDACMKKIKNLVILKEFAFYEGDKEDKETTKLFQQKWFKKLQSYIIDAYFNGYNLIGLGAIENNSFPKLKFVRPWNVSPDRLNITAYPYALGGLNFTDPTLVDANGNSFYDWSIWVTTDSETGPSDCGYGLLYKVAIYEIFLRNLLGFNNDYIEMFGQPYRWLQTDKQDEERSILERAMDEMGAAGYLVTGKDDILQFLSEGGGSGTSWKSFSDFENRMQKYISKIFFGHADALDSTPGKLGGEQGGDKSPSQIALNDTETVFSNFVEDVMNEQVIIKLQKIGFPIPVGRTFKYKNNKEKQEIKDKQVAQNVTISTTIKNLKDAGLEVDAVEASDLMGLKLTKSEPIDSNEDKEFNKQTTEVIKNFYAKAKH